jgi:ribosome-associated protein
LESSTGDKGELQKKIDSAIRKNNSEQDIKRGIGGIRQVEFILQTQQLISGGEYRLLRATSLNKIFTALQDEQLMDLRKINQAIADFFVIGSGNSTTQVDSISDSIEEVVYKQIQESPWQKEGRENKEWVLLDYVSVVAHVFRKDRREFYALEDLWGDAKVTHLNPESTQEVVKTK